MKAKWLIKLFLSCVIALLMVFDLTNVNQKSTYNVHGATIKISKKTLTLYVKKTKTLKITGTKSKVTWSSSKKSVAKVNSKGKVTAVKKGTATITAKVKGKKYKCKVTVKNPTISKTKLTLVEGAKTTLTVKNAVGTLKWSTSKKSVATVSSKGVVKGVKAGTATITVVASGVKLTCKVTVKAAFVDNTINVATAGSPYSLDPALAVAIDTQTIVTHLFSGLARYEVNSDGTTEIVADLAQKLVKPVKNSDGTYTYTYTLKDAKWSDGRAVTANDFVFAFNREVQIGSVYSYLLEVIDGYDSFFDHSTNPKLNISAVDNKTLKITTKSYQPSWNQLLANVAYFPLREDIVDDEDQWATKPSTCVTNGLYTLEDWTENQSITLLRNADHYNSSKATMNRIVFYLNEENDSMLEKYKKGEFDFISSFNNSDIENLKTTYPKEFKTEGALGTYYLEWNIATDLSPVNGTSLTQEQQAEVRSALSLLIDRQAICRTIYPGQIPASSLVGAAFTQSDGKLFHQCAGSSSGYYGYFNVAEEEMDNNTDKAMAILSKYYHVENGKVTDFPELTYVSPQGATYESFASSIKNSFAARGISLTFKGSSLSAYISLIKNGEFDIARAAWIADVDDAAELLKLFASSSDSNDVGFGQNTHASTSGYTVDLSGIGKGSLSGTWQNTYDQLIEMIDQEEDASNRDYMLHKAEDLLMSTGCVMPIYYYSQLYMISSHVNGFYKTPTGIDCFMGTTIK